MDNLERQYFEKEVEMLKTIVSNMQSQLPLG